MSDWCRVDVDWGIFTIWGFPWSVHVQFCTHNLSMHIRHYNDVTMSILASEVTGDSTVYLNVCLDIHKETSKPTLLDRGPVHSPHKWPVTRKPFSFDDVIMVFWELTNLVMTLWQWNTFYITGPLCRESIDHWLIHPTNADFFAVTLNKLLNQLSSGWWFETPYRSCDVTVKLMKSVLRLMCGCVMYVCSYSNIKSLSTIFFKATYIFMRIV